MSTSSPQPSVAEQVTQLKAMLALPSEELRLGVRKHVVTLGEGPHLTRPVAQCVVSYTLYTLDPPAAVAPLREASDETAKSSSSSSAADDELNVLGRGQFRVLEAQAAVAVTPGISSLVLGFEIGLLAMREGERALLQLPPEVGFPTSVKGGGLRVSPLQPLFYDVTVKSALGATRLPQGHTKFVQKDGTGATPDVGDIVSVLLRKTSPVTGIKLKPEKLTFAVGSAQSGPFDDALLSMREGEMSILFLGRLEHMLVLQSVAPAGHPGPLLQVRPGVDAAADSEPVTGPAAGPSPPTVSSAQRLRYLDIDPAFAASTLSSPLPPEERMAAVERLRDTGRGLMSIARTAEANAKAAATYRRAISILVAQPSLAEHPKNGLEARETLAVLYTNCGRAQLRADAPGAALVSAKEATMFAPNYGKGWYLYAQTLRVAGQLAEALAAFEKCAVLSGIDAGEVAKEIAFTQERIAEAAAAAAKAEAEQGAAAGGAE